tara:strand:- start:5735 stop:13606 length:7872 start_codon:yes stop_codon:yes gene_type:complete
MSTLQNDPDAIDPNMTPRRVENLEEQLPPGLGIASGPDRQVGVVETDTFSGAPPAPFEGFKSKFSGVNKRFGLVDKAPVPESPAKEMTAPTEGEIALKHGFKNNLKIASVTEAAQLAREYDQRHKELLAASGAKSYGDIGLDEDSLRRDWYGNKGYNLPEEVREYQPRRSATPSRIEEAGKQFLTDQSNEIVSFNASLVGDSVLESILPETYLVDQNKRQFYDERDLARLRKNSVSIDHFEAQMEVRQDQFLKYKEEHRLDPKTKKPRDMSKFKPGKSRLGTEYEIDLAEYDYEGHLSTYWQAFRQTGADTIDTVKWVGAAAGNTLGLVSNDDFVNYYNTQFVSQTQGIDAMARAAITDTYQEAKGGNHAFWAHTAEMAGMISFDAATSLATGGILSSAKFAKSLGTIAGEIGTASKSITSTAARPLLGHKASKELAEVFTRAAGMPLKGIAKGQGFNLFVTRFAIGAAGAAIEKQKDFANQEGRSLNEYDFVKAGIDMVYAGSVAKLISHWIPGIAKNKFGVSSAAKPLSQIANAPKSMPLAAARTASRIFAYGAKGSGSFLLFDSLLDGYQMATDVNEKDRIINSIFSGELAGRYFGNAVRGFMLAVPSMPGKARAEWNKQTQQFKGYQQTGEGRADLLYKYFAGENIEGITPFAKESKAKQRKIIGTFSEAYLEGMKARINEEVKAVTDGRVKIDLTDEQLIDILSFGDTVGGPLKALSSNDVLVHRHFGKLATRKDGAVSVAPIRALLNENGQVGITTAMARAELARRGTSQITMSPEGINGLYLSHKEFQLRQKTRQESKKGLIPKHESPRNQDIVPTPGIVTFGKKETQPIVTEPRGRGTLELFSALSIKEQRAIYNQAVHTTKLYASIQGDQKTLTTVEKERARVHKKSDAALKGYMPRSIRKSPALKKNLYSVMTETGHGPSFQKFRDRQFAEAIGRFIDNNPQHAAHYAYLAKRGKNTKTKPVISRIAFENMIGPKEARSLPEGINTASFRHKLGQIIYREVNARVNNPAQETGRATASEPRLGQEPGRKSPIPVEEQVGIEAPSRAPTTELPAETTVREVGQGRREGLPVAKTQDAPREIRHDAAATAKKITELQEKADSEPLNLEPVKAIDKKSPFFQEVKREFDPNAGEVRKPGGSALPNPNDSAKGGAILSASEPTLEARLEDTLSSLGSLLHSTALKPNDSKLHVFLDRPSTVNSFSQERVFNTARENGVSVAFYKFLDAYPIEGVKTEKDSTRGFTAFSKFSDVLAIPENSKETTALLHVAEHLAQQHWATKWSNIDPSFSNPLHIFRDIIEKPEAFEPIHQLFVEKGVLWEATGVMRQQEKSEMAEWALGTLFRTDERLFDHDISTNVARAKIFDQILSVLPEKTVAQLARDNPRLMSIWFEENIRFFEKMGATNKNKTRDVFTERKNTAYIKNLAKQEHISVAEAASSSMRAAIRAISKMPDKKLKIQGDPKKIALDNSTKLKLAQRDLQTKREEEGLSETKGSVSVGSKEPKLTHDQHVLAVQQVIEKIREDTPIFDLFDGIRYNRANVDAFKAAYPDLRARMNAEKRKNPTQEVLQFEHEGTAFTVHTVTKNNKKYFSQISAEDPRFVGDKGLSKEVYLDATAALLKERTETMIRENMESFIQDSVEAPIKGAKTASAAPEAIPASVGSEPPSGRPPSTPPPEGLGGEAGGPQKTFSIQDSVIDPPMGRHKLAAILQSLTDPLTTSIVSGSQAFREVMESLITINAKINDQKDRTQLEADAMMRAVEKDPNSTIYNKKIKSWDLLVDILDAEIRPTDSNLKQHPLTANLTKPETELVKHLKTMFQEQRLENMAMLREEAQLAYRSQGSAGRMAKKANQGFDLNVEVVTKNRKKFFRVGEQEIALADFPKYMAENHVVPKDWGKEYSYMPHMFFGDYKIAVTVTRGGKVLKQEYAGQGEKSPGVFRGTQIQNTREQGIKEASEIVDRIQEEYRDPKTGEVPSDISFDVVVTNPEKVIPTEAVHLDKKTRRQLVNTLSKAAGEHSSVINSALAGKITSQPVRTAFFASLLKREKNATGYSKDLPKVLRLSINNHYRHKMSKEVQKSIDPILPELSGWQAEYSRKLAKHFVFGSERAFENPTAERFWRSTNNYARKIQFYRQLYRVAQHPINTTQALQVIPVIGFTGFAKAVKLYNSRGGKKILEDWGSFDHNGYNSGKYGDAIDSSKGSLLESTHRIINKVTGKFWNASSETRNQNFAKVALFMHGKEKLKMTDADANNYAIVYGQVQTQYRFLRANDAPLLRSELGKTLGQFKRFPIQSFGLGASLLSGNIPGVASPKTAFARWMLVNLALGGVRGGLAGAALLGGADLTLEAYNAIRKSLDDKYTPDLPVFNTEAEMNKWLTSAAGQDLSDLIMYGPGALFGVDTSGTFNLMQFGYGKTRFDATANWLLGPTINMFTRTATDLSRRDVDARPVLTRLLESVINSGAATRGLKSLVELALYWDAFGNEYEKRFINTPVGVLSADKFSSATGELQNRLDVWGKLKNTLGFRSLGESADQLNHNTGFLLQEVYTEKLHEIASVYRQDKLKGMQMMSQWNTAYPLLSIMIGDLTSRIEGQQSRQNTTRSELAKERIHKKVSAYFEDKN